MIERIHGELLEKNPAFAIIDCGGLGYRVNITLGAYDQLPEKGKVQLFTHLQVREDAHTLYGFTSRRERELFRLLIGVSGVGATTAVAVLSALRPDDFESAVASGNAGTLQKIKGIGLKTAQRIVIDLKDKVQGVAGKNDNFGRPNNTVRLEALSALGTLGFDKKTAEKAVDAIIKEDETVGVEALIKLALKRL